MITHLRCIASSMWQIRSKDFNKEILNFINKNLMKNNLNLQLNNKFSKIKKVEVASNSHQNIAASGKQLATIKMTKKLRIQPWSQA